MTSLTVWTLFQTTDSASISWHYLWYMHLGSDWESCGRPVGLYEIKGFSEGFVTLDFLLLRFVDSQLGQALSIMSTSFHQSFLSVFSKPLLPAGNAIISRKIPTQVITRMLSSYNVRTDWLFSNHYWKVKEVRLDSGPQRHMWELFCLIDGIIKNYIFVKQSFVLMTAIDSWILNQQNSLEKEAEFVHANCQKNTI
jgi:hypothetical protein